MRRTTTSVLASGLVAALVWAHAAPTGQAAPKKAKGVYASIEEARQAGPDFDIQGEYEGTIGAAKEKIGVQVIALGGGAFQAVFLPGGLPGAGWDGKSRALCDGSLEGDKAVFVPAKGDRGYMDGNPKRFIAVRKFPPAGQKDYTASIEGGKLVGKTDTGAAIAAKKVLRKSTTLGAKPPEGATVLLAFTPGKAPSLEAWTNPKLLADPNGFMQVVRRGGSTNSKKRFAGPWRMHVEFRTPFQPPARGQGRGNSGVFPPGGREIQVLDSFGLEGLGNECGGIYGDRSPRVNMCLPPLSWQTYDVEYHPAEPGKKGSEQAWYKVVHNGVTIHEKVPLGGSRTGGLNLQDHGNPVAYRNIWFVVGKEAAKPGQ